MKLQITVATVEGVVRWSGMVNTEPDADTHFVGEHTLEELTQELREIEE